MAIDWKKVEEDAGSKYKNYAKPGTYKVKCVDVDIREVGTNGSVAQDFIFEEDDQYQYPKATHWLSFKNDSWRQWHNRNLMIVLGSSESTAEKAIDKIEALGDKEKIMKGYETAYKSLLKKKPEVEIEVFPDGKYSRAEFTDDRVAMPHDDAKPATADMDEVVPEDIDDSEEIDLSELPF